VTEPVNRHLSCIMFTDMVGYSALTQRDEALALELVAEHRALLRPIFAPHRGSEIKSTGDGFLVEFASALEATRCAVEIQRALVDRNAAVSPGKRFQIRIGLHLGDIEIQEGDVFGDGVNVAARVQQCAPSGGICVSGAVAEAVRNKLGHPLEPLGARRLKNIAAPVELFRVVLPWERQTPWSRLRARTRARAGSRGRAIVLGATSVVVAIGLAWAVLQGVRPTPAAEVHSLAVLPLEDVSPDPSEEYFTDGMTEALIGGLSRIGSLRVISRTSAMHYRDTNKRLPEIAQELGVDAVLEGSIVRAGDRVRISLRLVHAPTEQSLWSETYDRDLTDVLALQDEIARAVATAVRAQLTPDEAARLASAGQVDPRAYEAYLRGRYWWNTRTRDGLDKALVYFRQAIEIDPTWARGYAGLADAYLVLGYNRFLPLGDVYPKARGAALRAIELDENLAEAHASLAAEMRDYEWDWARSEQEFERALDLDPNYATGWHWYAWNLVSLGRIEDALTTMRKARELDPLSPRINTNIGVLLYLARDYEAAERELKKSLEADSSQSLRTLGSIYVQQGRFAEAIRAFQELAHFGTPTDPAYLAHAYALAGRRSEARGIVEELERREGARFVDPLAMAMAYTGLGDLDRAFWWLERGYRERDLRPSLLRADPVFDPLRRDPRFADLLRRMGLEPAAPAGRN
jgi:TolB-like protein/class 3 adenylate cyclase/Tfp pilus assembly protein PilF